MKSVYIHIPFCNNICSYCDFCKMKYNKEWIDNYLDSLKCEIENYYKGEKIKTLYIGGGTPSSLSMIELNKLFSIIELLDLSMLEEFTFECNIESITNEKLILLKKNKVNRLSIGVQTFNENLLRFLNRSHNKDEVKDKIEMAKLVGFNNINIDLMYALPLEAMDDLKEDIKLFIDLDIPHISCYSLMIEPNTKLYIDKIKQIDEDLDYEMYKYIEDELTSNNYIHYEVSNYCKKGYESKHNLVYWNNEYYYGFGLGASGYLENYRYDNTKNLRKYLDHNYIDNITKIRVEDRIKYHLILGFRKLNGINKDRFKKIYNKSIYDVKNIKMLLNKGMLMEDDTHIFIPKEWIYRQNEILIKLI